MMGGHPMMVAQPMGTMGGRNLPTLYVGDLD
jgi:hypothetical protein